MTTALVDNFVGAPFVVLSTSDPGRGDLIPEEGIVLTNEDGTLISYSEEWNGEQYGIELQLVDPDGIFISKIFSFYIDTLRSYFTNFSKLGNAARDYEIARKWRREYIDYLKKNVRRDPRAIGEIMTLDQAEYGLTSEQKEIAAQASFEKAINDLENVDIWKDKIPELQKALEDLNAFPDLYINVGVGSGKFNNFSGYKHVILKNLVINQDSGKEHLVYVNLLADTVLNESEKDLPISTGQTNSELGAPSYFPKADSPHKSIILVDAEWSTKGAYSEINSLKITPNKVNANNTSQIVHAIEDLLEKYLDEYKIHGIVFLNPALEFEIQKLFSKESPLAGKSLHALNRRLKNCGISLKVSSEVLSSEKVTDGAKALRIRSGSRSRVSFEDEITTFRGVYSLQLDVTDTSISKKERVLNIIKKLYTEFNVFPNDVGYKVINKDGRIEDIYRQLYTAQVSPDLPEPYNKAFTKGTKQYFQKLSDIERQETNTATLKKTTFVKKSVSAEERVIHLKGDDPRNILAIGDSYFMDALLFPLDPLFTENEFEEYEKFIGSNLFRYGQWTKSFCNISTFVIGSAEQGMLDYLKKYTEDSVISKTNQENLIPDEYALRFTDVEINTILKISEIFIAGSENSNVHEITSKEDGYAFSEFLNFFNIARIKGIKTARDSIKQSYNNSNRDYNLSEEELEGIIDNILNQTFSNASITRLLEHVYTKPIRETETVKSLRKAYSLIVEEIKNSTQVTDRSIDPKALTSYLAYVNNLSNRTRDIVIRTNPSFYIDESKIGHPAFFFHKNPFITSSQSPFSSMSVLNGLYKIYGYKHVIDEGDCYTEVVLQRTAMSESLRVSADLGIETLQ